ncbi:MAG: HAD-IIB family hydrolase [Chloroflexi bacterium OHK40]
MHLKTLACDLDGTLAEHGHVAPETWASLQRLKEAGWSLILVTGRVLQTFAPGGPYGELFDVLIAEGGAVVYFPRRDLVRLPFGRLSDDLLARLVALSIPLERGLAIAATRVPHDLSVLQVLHDTAGGATVEYNRGAVMVLPPGATKGTGLQYALRELGRSVHNVIACGDAENDRSLFAIAELAVAVSNATDDLRALADLVLPAPNGAGVRALAEDLLRARLPASRPRPSRMLTIGNGPEETPVFIDPFELLDGSLAIVGASGSGKSWLAGLLAEALLEQGYQICLIDPEGDYRALRAFPHTLLLGGDSAPLPPIADVVTLGEYAEMSLVLDLSLTPPEQQAGYAASLLHALHSLRANHGRPHWLLVDEVQSLCPPAGSETADALSLLASEGGVGIVTYRPDQVPPRLLDVIDHWLITRLDAPAELAAINSRLERSPGWAEQMATLPALPRGHAVLYTDTRGSDPPAPQPVIFRAGPRTVPHIRHLHKYLRAPLPYERRFFFHNAQGSYLGQSAANLWEFRVALGTLPLGSLRYHLERGDFERWVRQVLHDDELAARLNKLARRHLAGEALRSALVSVVGDRYAELDSLI